MPVADPPTLRRLSASLGAGVVAAVPITLLALVVRERSDMVFRGDDAVLRVATGLTRESPPLLQAMMVWQEVTQPVWLVSAGGLLCLVAWRRWHLGTRAAWAAATMVTVWAGQYLLKLLAQRARPMLEDPLAHAPGYSFPSGHAATSSGIALTLLVLAWPRLGSRPARVVALAAAAAVTAVTCVNRVLLGVHYPSDVIGGVLIGAGLVGVGWAAFRPRRRATATDGASHRRVEAR